MHRNFLIIILILFCFQASGQEIKYSKEQIREDLSFLQLQLQKSHPNLYVYSSKVEIDNSFEQLKNSVSDSLTTTESYNVISSTCSIVKDGHYTIQPSEQILSEFYINSKLLPIDIYWTEESAYVIRNYSNTEVEIGSKILAINGTDLNKIQESILTGLLRDGNNSTYPYWILNNFGRAYYSFHFGSSDKYEIQIIDTSQKIKTFSLNGIVSKKISEIRKSKYPLYHQKLNEEKGIDLKIDKNTAVLTIKSFENKILKKTYNQKFRKTIKAHFETIDKQGIENLIIDIRGNQGGEVTNGIFLLRYLLNEPFQAVQEFTLVDKKHYNDTQNRNKIVRGIGNGYHSPFDTNYKGNLYVLTNGGSFSCSGIFSQIIKKTQRGTLIGVETGGSAYTLVGAPNRELILPNTKIQVTIPRLQFILQKYEGKQKTGVIPNKTIQPTLTDIINNIDSEFTYTLKLINK